MFVKAKKKEMQSKKSKAHPTLVNGGGFGSNRRCVDGDDFQRKNTEPIDHWAFLEEIDAPTWADLTLESLSMDQDIDDGWFQVAHPFHQVSSYHLMSTSSVFGEEKINLDSDLLANSPPKLPPSVSKSRGKHYKSRKWRKGNVDKQHPIRILGRSTVRVTSVKPKVKTNYGNVKHASDLKGKSASGGASIATRGPNSIQSKPSFRNPKNTSITKSKWSADTSTYSVKGISSRTEPSVGCSGSTSSSSTSFTGKSNSTSTNGPFTSKHRVTLGDSAIACTTRTNSLKNKATFGVLENTSSMNASSSASFDVPDSLEQKSSFGGLKTASNSIENTGTEDNSREAQMTFDSSHQILGQAMGLLSAVRLSLRKNSVTRQPSRVEVKDKRESKGRKSSLSKSSVGSNSNSGSKLTVLAARMKKSITPQSRTVGKMDQSTNGNKVKVNNMPKTSNGGLLDFRPKFKREGRNDTARIIHQEISKSKVLCHFERRKPLRLQNVQDSPSGGIKAKECLPSNHKVNEFGGNISSQKVGEKENNMGSTMWKTSDSAAEVKDKGLTGAKAKAIARNKIKNPKNAVQRTYFR